jgi:hypothetical protein
MAIGRFSQCFFAGHGFYIAELNAVLFCQALILGATGLID